MIVKKFIQKIHEGKVSLPVLKRGYAWVLKSHEVSIVDEKNLPITSWMWTKFSDGDGIKIKWFDKAKQEVESCNYWRKERAYFDKTLREAVKKHKKKREQNGKNI